MQSGPLKLVFFGSDSFSLFSLQACLESSHTMSLIVTTPPQKKGRGLILTPNPVQEFAEAHRLNWTAPATLKDPSTLETIRNLQPDLFVVSSYGKMIPDSYLGLPSIAPVNVHPSLLPKYRGSGPIQWTILNGDKETGVSLIEVASRLDAGDIFYQTVISVAPDETTPTLWEKLGHLSKSMLAELLNGLPATTIPRRPQDETRSTYARKLTKEDALIRLDLPAVEIERKIRGLKPWPGTYLSLGKEDRLMILDGKAEPGSHHKQPGTVLDITGESLILAAGEGTLVLKTVQPSGKKPMGAADYARGRRLQAGSLLCGVPCGPGGPVS